MTIKKEPYGTLSTGQAVDCYTLQNSAGLIAKIINYGGIITSLMVPDKNGKMDDVVLGLPTLEEYETKNPFFGCITGRFANRIAKGKFTLEGKEYQLAINNGPNALHGGKRGFDKQLWTVEKADAAGLVMSHLSPDGHEGYPGKLHVTVTYALTEDNGLSIRYRAITDQATVVNLTNHSYFNLAGEGQGDVLAHRLLLNSTSCTPTDQALIPTGKIESVLGSALDFSTEHTLGERINARETALEFGGGYDHNYVIPGKGLRLAATVTDPASGRVMTVKTTEPAIQLYTANGLNIPQGKSGKPYGKRSAFCLETQHYPDSPNHPSFPTTVLQPEETLDSTTVYAFGIAP